MNVKNNGKFTINNPGNGSSNDGGDAVGNQGIHYIKAPDITGDRNEFNVTGQGSEVRIAANSGPAIDMHDQPGLITASDGGYFEARGKTSTTNTGIFRTSDRLEVVFDKPLFMDFTNTRGNGENIFTVNSSSTLKATKSDLSLWKKGTGVEQDPDLNFIDLNYAFKGSNFDTLGATNRPGEFNTNTIRAVSDFKFPHVPIGTTRAIKLDKLTPEPSEGAKGYSSGIEVADMSGTAKGWSVSVAMTTPLQTTEGKELKGWELYIPTEKVKSGGVETKDAIGHTVTVTKEGATGSVFSAAQGKGKGRFADIFESYTEEATTEEGLTRKKGVQLTVPSGAYKGAYQGKLTWTLQNVPN